MSNFKVIRLIATRAKGVYAGEREEIDDLFWFEENHVHDFSDPFYTFEIIIDGESYVPTNATK